MKKYPLSLTIAGILAVSSQTVFAASFVVQDIRVQGLQRVAVGTVLNYLPVRAGQSFDESQVPGAIQSLYQSGLFEDVKLSRQGNMLVVSVSERSAIGQINITGNKKLKTEQLLQAMKSAKVGRGDALSRSALQAFQKSLEAQYASMGYHGVKVNTQVQPLSDGRSAINLNIDEGKEARIKQLKITGNQAFSEAELLKKLDSGPKGVFSIPFFSTRDKYAKEKLIGDLDVLTSFYRDRGYLNFAIANTDVSLSPDKQGVFIKVTVSEGDQFRLGKVGVSGNHGLSPAQIQQAVTLVPGHVFSQKTMEETRKNLGDLLGEQGYAFAKINPIPQIDKANKRVGLDLNIALGKRTYVRRINIRGNHRTNDEVYRREMRQLESSSFSRKSLERSKARLRRLPYVETAQINVEPVAGTSDQVDLNIIITERSSNQFKIGAGYSQSNGVLLNLGVKQDNFMGTGKKLEVNFDNSESNKNYLISYTNPYYTENGVSRGFSLYYKDFDAEAADISEYTTNRFGGAVNFGVPISEHNAVNASIGYEQVEVVLGENVADHIAAFTDDNGFEYNQIPMKVSFVHDSRDRVIFPSAGQRHRVSLQASLPGSDLEYQKLSYDGAYYKAINDDITFALKGRIAAGSGRGDLDGLPFFEKYNAGGIRTVRGYESNSLGPKDSNGDAMGGDLLVAASAQVLFPVPFAEDAKNLRLSAFVDAGNVFEDIDSFDSGDLRYSVGIGAVWLSPLGPFEVSYAKPLNSKDGDDEQVVQFSIGASF
uniref:Outer membrane protein assembly factor BamA n=1 Tax=uncultured Thiotrichaceae bacterium TaxID=298394 RepID=A0A6S6SFD2_9GAMM|nr:MAG: Outer membrane protein assembly factor YaeT precursor [uncultured Thiotrichaceae bacterium]